MTGREQFVKLEAAENGHLAKIKELEAEAGRLRAGMEELDAAALRAEVLKESGWEAKRDELARAKRRLAEVEDEISRAERGRAILKAEKDKAAKGISAEILGEFKPKIEPLLREFYKRLVAAGEAEQRIIDLELAAWRECQRYFPGTQVHLQGTGWPDLSIIRDGGFLLKEFVQRCKMNGLEVE